MSCSHAYAVVVGSGSAGVVQAASSLPTFGWGTVFTQVRFELAPVLGIVLAAGFYGLGVRQLSARGDRWPVGRTIGFAAGL
ncbi:MAG: cytochrome c oxidase caa3-type, assembly factor ctag-related protein, partial [Acidimicrobiales bacterium]|nr:cytochrome c oxidase caa3-type, assembly factor ctag-related protein [Acidimicrobiales bacterium]